MNIFKGGSTKTNHAQAQAQDDDHYDLSLPPVSNDERLMIQRMILDVLTQMPKFNSYEELDAYMLGLAHLQNHVKRHPMKEPTSEGKEEKNETT